MHVLKALSCGPVAQHTTHRQTAANEMHYTTNDQYTSIVALQPRNPAHETFISQFKCCNRIRRPDKEFWDTANKFQDTILRSTSEKN